MSLRCDVGLAEKAGRLLTGHLRPVAQLRHYAGRFALCGMPRQDGRPATMENKNISARHSLHARKTRSVMMILGISHLRGEIFQEFLGHNASSRI